MQQTLHASDTVIVKKHTTEWELYTVWILARGEKTIKKTFRGENAWANTERYAYDHDRTALFCTTRHNLV
jgi:hypothetical protein